MVRGITFWVFTLLVAWGATALKAKTLMDKNIGLAPSSEFQAIIDISPNSSRSIAFSLGFIAVALTYRHAWLNRPRRPDLGS